MRAFGLVASVILLMFLTALGTERIVAGRYEFEIKQMKGDLAIYKSQAENYAKVLRSIRETASSATSVEKAEHGMLDAGQ